MKRRDALKLIPAFVAGLFCSKASAGTERPTELKAGQVWLEHIESEFGPAHFLYILHQHYIRPKSEWAVAQMYFYNSRKTGPYTGLMSAMMLTQTEAEATLLKCQYVGSLPDMVLRALGA